MYCEANPRAFKIRRPNVHRPLKTKAAIIKENHIDQPRSVGRSISSPATTFVLWYLRSHQSRKSEVTIKSSASSLPG